jgi:integrase
MTVRIDSVSSRQRLRPRREPYWHRVAKGCYLGVRKMTSDGEGTWVARAADEATGKQLYKALSEFSEHPAHERFDLAKKAAQEWFDHLGRGGSSEAVTVAGACGEYVAHLRSEGRNEAAKDVEGRFKRWVYPTKLASVPLLKLSPKAVADWRTALAKTPAIPQDKQKAATKPRSASALNRDMTALRAALNFARENGHATTDQAWHSKLKPVDNADGRRDVYLDADQRRKLIEAAPEDLAALLRALSLVPLRPGAMAGLTAASFDGRLLTLTIGKDKAGADRKITLPKGTAAFFESMCKDKLPGAPLLARADGKPWDKDAWKGPIKDAVIAAKLPMATTAYALRHSTITDLIALHKLDTLTVAQLSGTSLQMIERHYGHLLRDHAANALAKLAL